ncbi:MAG: OmpA family protein [Bacteroidota bacterium]
MRKLYSLICYCCLALSLSAQEAPKASDNIVPNPGFERYSATPIGWFYKGSHFTDVMKYWSSATGASPDVFGPKVRVPSHWAAKGFGQQRAHGGKSMAGITAYGCEHGKPHCREYLQIQLSEPLVVGQEYYAEFWVNHLPRSLQINSLGLCFTQEKVDTKIDVPLDFTPQIIAEEIISTPGNSWAKVSGRFTAERPDEYLIIGNFCPDSMTQAYFGVANHLNYAYYYIDDVIVRKEEPIVDVPVSDDDLTRIPLEQGKLIPLKNIFFDHDKAELLPRSYVELRKLLQVMQQNPTLVIEINGHTSSIGDFDYNINLSHRRAKAVVDFLLDNGIRAQRARYKGYGSTRPIASNDREEGRSLNRRVEFLVIHK